MAKEGVICQLCGLEAPSRQVEFHQNIGVLVMRFHRQVKGKLCKNCIQKTFWKMTSITLLVGWLGIISLVLAPIFIINNIVRYVGALGMPPVPAGAKIPILDQEAVAKIEPKRGELVTRLNNKEELLVVSRDVAAKAGVTPGQVVKFIAAISRQAAGPVAVPPVQGFPVIPVPPRAIQQPSAASVAPPLPPAADAGAIAAGPIAAQPPAGGGPDPLLPI